MFFRSLPLLIAGLFSVFSATAQTTPTNITRQYAFPPVGLGSTQTARVNVANTAANASSGTAASCTGTVTFVNASGTTIGSAMPFIVTSGQIFAASLPFGSTGVATNVTHTEFIASVQLNSPTTSPRPPCTLQTSLELDDTNSGDVEVVLPTATLSVGPIAVGPLF